MCNRIVQKDAPIKPGGKVTVLMRGPQGEFEMPFTEAVFGGPAKRESREMRSMFYWMTIPLHRVNGTAENGAG
jgi:hypothetical protein